MKLVQTILGYEPFILLEFKKGDNKEELKATITFGGGIQQSDLREALVLAVESLSE